MNMTLATRRALCAVMVFAVVEKAGTIVMKDKEELDSWSIILNGHVQIQHSDGCSNELQVGDWYENLKYYSELNLTMIWD